MKRSIRNMWLLYTVFLMSAILLTGCGEDLYELQENEKAIIVNYAAHIVAKYNTKQPEGYRYVYVPEEEEVPQKEEAPQEEETPQEQPSEEPISDEQGAQDAGIGQDGQEIPPGTAENEPIPEEPEPAVTLSEALGLKKIKAVYTGAELTDYYDTVVPDEGKQLMILHVTLQNTTKKSQSCDILSKFPVFRATVNGTEQTTAELTLLPQNLGTWEEKISAGKSVETIILFQVKKDEIASVDQLELQVTTEEKTSRVIFL